MTISAPTVTNAMIAAGWAAAVAMKPALGDFVDEVESAPIMNAVFKAMYAAAPYAPLHLSKPVPPRPPEDFIDD